MVRITITSHRPFLWSDDFEENIPVEMKRGHAGIRIGLEADLGYDFFIANHPLASDTALFRPMADEFERRLKAALSPVVTHHIRELAASIEHYRAPGRATLAKLRGRL